MRAAVTPVRAAVAPVRAAVHHHRRPREGRRLHLPQDGVARAARPLDSGSGLERAETIRRPCHRCVRLPPWLPRRSSLARFGRASPSRESSNHLMREAIGAERYLWSRGRMGNQRHSEVIRGNHLWSRGRMGAPRRQRATARGVQSAPAPSTTRARADPSNRAHSPRAARWS